MTDTTASQATSGYHSPGSEEDDYPCLKTRVDLGHAEDDAVSVISQLQPDWDQEQVAVRRLTNGITNVILKCKYKDSRMLLRIYGKNTDMLIDRQRELRNHSVLHACGLAPPILGVFANGYAYGYCFGHACDPQTVRSPEVFPLIARRLGRIHRTIPLKDVAEDTSPVLFPTLRKWIAMLPDSFSDETKNTLYQKHFDKDTLLKDTAELEEVLTALNSPIVFCHNDLLCHNIILNDSHRVSFIDYEYGGPNFRGFDIGNHFCEFAGTDEPDYSLYPDKDMQYRWLRTYLAEMQQVDEERVDQTDVASLYREVNKFALAAHLFWAIWAIIQEYFSTIDFDYLGYGVVRYQQLHKRKAEFLAL